MSFFEEYRRLVENADYVLCGYGDSARCASKVVWYRNIKYRYELHPSLLAWCTQLGTGQWAELSGPEEYDNLTLQLLPKTIGEI